MAVQNTSNELVLTGRLARARRMPLWMEPYVTLLRTKPLATFGLVCLVVMMTAALFAEVLAPYDPIEMDLTQKLRPPSAAHPMGTDQFGRDLLSRIIYGARISLYIGMGVVVLGTFTATIWGCLTGYFGGTFDMLTTRVIDALLSIPNLVLILTVVTILGPGVLNVMLALAFRTAVAQTRTLRSAVIGIRSNMYIDAAKAIGASHTRILALYILPNIMGPVIVVASVTLGQAILAESSLSFLGFGVPPPYPTWGGMLSAEGRRYMITAPWMAIAPGVALSLAIFGINMLGDGLRDVLDPRLRGARG